MPSSDRGAPQNPPHRQLLGVMSPARRWLALPRLADHGAYFLHVPSIWVDTALMAASKSE